MTCLLEVAANAALRLSPRLDVCEFCDRPGPSPPQRSSSSPLLLTLAFSFLYLFVVREVSHDAFKVLSLSGLPIVQC